MYVRAKSSPRSKNISIQIVKSQRIDGKIKQHVIRHVGTTTPGAALEELKQVARSIIIELQHDEMLLKKKPYASVNSSRFGQLLSVDGALLLRGVSLEESKRVILGIHDVYGYIYDHIGFKNPFSHPSKRQRSAQILREIVLARIANPDSKRASVHILAKQFGVKLKLDHVYQMMDKIDDGFCEQIQKYALQSTLQLTGEKLRVLFYDATTLYFESFTEDELKRNGYSKDLKFNQPQVVLALFMTENGLPVGYELFPGNTFEGHTLTTSLHKLKERYQIDQVVLVADRGMFSDKNLRFMQEHHYRYIVGARLKSLDETSQSQILSWLDSLDKETITDEITHRIQVTSKSECLIKIFFAPLTHEDHGKMFKPTYVLWRENEQWHLAFYEEVELIKMIPLSDIPELSVILLAIPEFDKKLSRNSRAAIKSLIVTYHNQPRWLVLSYRTQRALKDRRDREKAIQKLQQRLRRSHNPKQLISQYGFQKFIQVEGDAELQIDQNWTLAIFYKLHLKTIDYVFYANYRRKPVSI